MPRSRMDGGRAGPAAVTQGLMLGRSLSCSRFEILHFGTRGPSSHWVLSLANRVAGPVGESPGWWGGAVPSHGAIAVLERA